MSRIKMTIVCEGPHDLSPALDAAHDLADCLEGTPYHADHDQTSVEYADRGLSFEDLKRIIWQDYLKNGNAALSKALDTLASAAADANEHDITAAFDRLNRECFS